MMTIIKIIVLQSFWFLAIRTGEPYQEIVFAASLAVIGLNFFIYKPKISGFHYSLILLFFVLYGFIEETLVAKLGFVNYQQESFPLWLSSLYVVFLGYYGDLFEKFNSLQWWVLSLVGGLGGLSAFWSGSKLSSMTVESSNYFVAIFISWAIFFPLSLKIFRLASKKHLSLKGGLHV